MRRPGITQLLLIAFTLSTPAATAQERTPSDTVRVMTFNVRRGNAKDGPNEWSKRRALVSKCIRAQEADVVGLQEALDFQIQYLLKKSTEFATVGHGREGGREGEYTPILYRKARFGVRATGTFWLSDTPGTRSVSWSASLPRICTWAQLEEHATGRFLYVFNTHWDHKSQDSRERSAQLIVERIADRRPSAPVLLLGDFNTEVGSPAIKALSLGKLKDTFKPKKGQPAGTNCGFSGRTTGKRLDMIFQRGLKAAPAEIVRWHQNERYPSDHFPVVCDVSWAR